MNNDTIGFMYDELGRVSNRSINGAANSETWAFDSLGRTSSDANKLGTFNYSYVGVTNRLQTLTYPNATTASYTYLPNLQDKRLQQIKNQTSASVLLSQFDYTYDLEGEIKTWTKNYPGLSTPQRYDLTYDNADQVTNAPLKNATTNVLVKQYIYGYDLAANRTSERIGNQTTTSTPNNVNEITSQSGGTNRTLSYDLNGSLTSDGGTRTFEWDAANRLVAVNYTGTTQRTEFSYDGLNRCVKLVEKTGSTTNSTRKFVWCGMERCEFRNANGAVQFQLYRQGQYQSGAAYLYTRDHLGSIREMTNTSGTVVARYDYDPWGRSTTVIGTNKPDFNFTGHYKHARSGLDMAIYRAYDPGLGRWLNRDPIEENGGLNLYRYCDNKPMDETDLLGLFSPGGFVLPPIVEPYVPFFPPVPLVPTPADPTRPDLARRWYCTATCNIQVIDPKRCPNPPARVSGFGTGSSEEEACREAKRDAVQKAPSGTYARHCKCRCVFGRYGYDIL